MSKQHGGVKLKARAVDETLAKLKKLLNAAKLVDDVQPELDEVLQFMLEHLEHAQALYQQQLEAQGDIYVAKALQGPPVRNGVNKNVLEECIRKALQVTQAIQDLATARKGQIVAELESVDRYDASERGSIAFQFDFRSSQLQMARRWYLAGNKARGDTHLSKALAGPRPDANE